MSVYNDQDLCRECGAHFSEPHDPQCPNEKESESVKLARGLIYLYGKRALGL